MRGTIRGTGDKATFWVDGKQVTEKEFWEVFPPKEISGRSLSTTPVKLSDALAVHPDQVQEATEYLKKRGVPTEFVPSGEPIIKSRAHQKEILKVWGYHNKDGGYGD